MDANEVSSPQDEAHGGAEAIRSCYTFSMKNSETIITDFYKALNRNDLGGAITLFHPEIFREEFVTKTFRGLQEMEGNLRGGRSTWAEGSCTPLELKSVGEKFIVHVHVRVRLHNKTDWIDGYVFDGFNFKDGKIVEFHSFSDEKKASEWAGRT